MWERDDVAVASPLSLSFPLSTTILVMAKYIAYSEDKENVLGTFIFLGYIIAALYFSFRILTLLRHHYAANPISQEKQSKITLFSILTFLSFASISFHFLSFLHLSYSDWSERNGVSGIHLWQWMIHNTHFLDFAKALAATPQRWWWTQLSLLQTMDAACWMAQNGKWSQSSAKIIPNL